MEYRHSEIGPSLVGTSARPATGLAIDKHMADWVAKGWTLHSTTAAAMPFGGIQFLVHSFTWQREKPAADPA